MSPERGNVSKHGVICKFEKVLLRRHNSTDGHSSAKRFAECENVWNNAVMFKSKPFSGASHSALDLVKNEQGTYFGTTGAQGM